MIFFLFGSPVLFDEEMVNFFHFAFAHPSIGMLLLPPLSLCATPCFSFPFSLSRIFLCVWVAFLTMLFFLQFFSLRSAYICHCKSPFINVHLCMYDVFGESNDTYYPFLFPCHLFPLPFSSCMVLLSEIHGDFFLTHFYAKCSCHIRIIFFRLDDLCSI